MGWARSRTGLALSGLVAAALGCSPQPGAGGAATASAPHASTGSLLPAPPASSSLEAESAPRAPFRSEEVFSLRITGGDVIDGSGHPRVRAEVLVRDGRIAFVGNVDPSVRAERVIDASGAVVTPGFIDMHSHFDPKGDVEPALAQGVTLVVVGQDGDSPAKHIGAWLDSFTASPPRINVATLVGHVTVRNASGLGTKAKLDDADREKLSVEVQRALDEGAFGLSTGLEYDPGRLADAAELGALARPVGQRGGVIMSHLRSEDDDQIDAAIDELVAQAKSSGARAHVSHLKVVYGKGASRADALIAKLDRVRAEGVDITADMYPYDASYTTIAILFPTYARESYASAKAHRSDELLAYLRERVTKRGGPEATLFGTGDLAGKTLAEVAKTRGVPFERVLFDLGPTGAHAAYFVMDDALQSRLFLAPYVSVGTDGGGGSPHPRGYGTFARVIEELVEKRKALSLEEAVRKMTSLAANTLRLDGERGCLAEGCAADLAIFVPGEIHTAADFVHAFEIARGMRFVVVNGKVEREGAKATLLHAGLALRFAPKAATGRGGATRR